jgi:hypothetical protein
MVVWCSVKLALLDATLEGGRDCLVTLAFKAAQASATHDDDAHTQDERLSSLLLDLRGHGAPLG